MLNVFVGEIERFGTRDAPNSNIEERKGNDPNLTLPLVTNDRPQNASLPYWWIHLLEHGSRDVVPWAGRFMDGGYMWWYERGGSYPITLLWGYERGRFVCSMLTVERCCVRGGM